MFNTLILIPTFNESLNVEKLYRALKKLNFKADILFVDDNSPDGTADIIKRIIKKDQSVNLLSRGSKQGIGSAHLAGIDWAYKNNYKTLISMDCDLTHKPEDIKKLLKADKKFEVVIGSRYLSKKSLSEWNIIRKNITIVAHFLTTKLLNIPYDATGAFRLYRIDKISKEVFNLVASKGYSFFFESLFILSVNKYKIKEVPINLPARTYGHSKMSIEDAWKSLVFLYQTFYQSKTYKNSYIYSPGTIKGNRYPGKTEKEWDQYWSANQKSRKVLYDTIAVFYRTHIIKRSLNHFIDITFKKEQKILHAGCGSGLVDADVVNKVKVTALDISTEALNRYKQLYGNSCEILYGDIFKIPSKSESFDGIYNLGVMEHFSEKELKKIFDEFYRVLTPGGKILLFWPPQFGLSVIFLNTLHFVLNNLFNKKIRLHPHEITKVKSRKQIEDILSISKFKLTNFTFGPRDLFTYVVITGQKLI